MSPRLRQNKQTNTKQSFPETGRPADNQADVNQGDVNRNNQNKHKDRINIENKKCLTSESKGPNTPISEKNKNTATKVASTLGWLFDNTSF